MSVRAWIQELFLRILNLESWIQKTLQSLQSFWDSRFKIILGDSMCVCVCVYVSVYMVIGVLLYIYIYVNVIYIYIWHPPQVNQTLVLNPQNVGFGGVPYIYISVCVCMCVCLFIYLFICPFIYSCIHLFIAIYIYTHLSLSLGDVHPRYGK